MKVALTAAGSSPKRRWPAVRRAASGAFAALCLLGVLLHITVGDAAPSPLFTVYYALPRPLLCVLALAATAVSVDLWFRRMAWMSLAMLGAWLLAADVGWNPAAREMTDDAFRVAFWNAQACQYGLEAAGDEVAAFQADVIGLVEAERNFPLSLDPTFWRRRFPECSVEHPQKGMVLLVRGRVLIRGYQRLARGSHARWWDVELRGREFRVVIVDIASNPLQPRQAALAQLQSLVESSSNRPVLVMGDFNTPLGAPSLNALERSGMKSAEKVRGRGYHCTWPTPVPVLTLDQIWTSPHFAVHASGTGWTWQSDHRPVSAVVTIGTTAAADIAVSASP
jgi:endonuclease/exonuclease/phosphatase (EEP) superfamily protein YafD